MSLARVLLLLALCAVVGCTPIRSKIAPPYLIDGRSYSAEQLESYANEQCAGATIPPPNKFTTDGCSAWPDKGKDQGEGDGWRSCCIKHDVAYWCGAVVRREADQAFRACVRDASSPANANVMYSGVRVGGGRFMPFPWRFGYGHSWPHRKPAPAPSNKVTSSESSPQTPLTGR